MFNVTMTPNRNPIATSPVIGGRRAHQLHFENGEPIQAEGYAFCTRTTDQDEEKAWSGLVMNMRKLGRSNETAYV